MTENTTHYYEDQFDSFYGLNIDKSKEYNLSEPAKGAAIEQIIAPPKPIISQRGVDEQLDNGEGFSPEDGTQIDPNGASNPSFNIGNPVTALTDALGNPISNAVDQISNFGLAPKSGELDAVDLIQQFAGGVAPGLGMIVGSGADLAELSNAGHEIELGDVGRAVANNIPLVGWAVDSPLEARVAAQLGKDPAKAAAKDGKTSPEVAAAVRAATRGVDANRQVAPGVYAATPNLFGGVPLLHGTSESGGVAIGYNNNGIAVDSNGNPALNDGLRSYSSFNAWKDDLFSDDRQVKEVDGSQYQDSATATAETQAHQESVATANAARGQNDYSWTAEDGGYSGGGSENAGGGPDGPGEDSLGGIT